MTVLEDISRLVYEAQASPKGRARLRVIFQEILSDPSSAEIVKRTATRAVERLDYLDAHGIQGMA